MIRVPVETHDTRKYLGFMPLSGLQEMPVTGAFVYMDGSMWEVVAIEQKMDCDYHPISSTILVRGWAEGLRRLSDRGLLH